MLAGGRKNVGTRNPRLISPQIVRDQARTDISRLLAPAELGSNHGGFLTQP